MNNRELYGLCSGGGGFWGSVGSFFSSIGSAISNAISYIGNQISSCWNYLTSDQSAQPGNNTNPSAGTGSGGSSGGGGSALGNALRKVPLLGGILGGVGDVVSGVGNVAAGIVTLGQSGTLERGFDQIGSGIGGELNIFMRDVAAGAMGLVGTAFTTLTDVYNVATFGTQTLPDRSNSPADPTGPLGAIKRLLFDALIPDYGFMGGANWGTTQFGVNGPSLNWIDYSSQQHDNDGIDRDWVKRGWSGTPDGQVASGPVGIVYVLAGTIPFWLHNGQGYK